MSDADAPHHPLDDPDNLFDDPSFTEDFGDGLGPPPFVDPIVDPSSAGAAGHAYDATPGSLATINVVDAESRRLFLLDGVFWVVKPDTKGFSPSVFGAKGGRASKRFRPLAFKRSGVASKVWVRLPVHRRANEVQPGCWWLPLSVTHPPSCLHECVFLLGGGLGESSSGRDKVSRVVWVPEAQRESFLRSVGEREEHVDLDASFLLPPDPSSSSPSDPIPPGHYCSDCAWLFVKRLIEVWPLVGIPHLKGLGLSRLTNSLKSLRQSISAPPSTSLPPDGRNVTEPDIFKALRDACDGDAAHVPNISIPSCLSRGGRLLGKDGSEDGSLVSLHATASLVLGALCYFGMRERNEEPALGSLASVFKPNPEEFGVTKDAVLDFARGLCLPERGHTSHESPHRRPRPLPESEVPDRAPSRARATSPHVTRVYANGDTTSLTAPLYDAQGPVVAPPSSLDLSELSTGGAGMSLEGQRVAADVRGKRPLPAAQPQHERGTFHRTRPRLREPPVEPSADDEFVYIESPKDRWRRTYFDSDPLSKYADGKDHVRRSWVLVELNRSLVQSSVQVVLLRGEHGSGKTDIMCSLVRENLLQLPVVGWYFCRSGANRVTEFVLTMHAMLAHTIPQYAACFSPVSPCHFALESAKDNPVDAWRGGVLEALKSLSRQPAGNESGVGAATEGPRPCCIVIDALDEDVDMWSVSATSAIGSLLLDRVHCPPKWLKIVVSTRMIPQVLSLFPTHASWWQAVSIGSEEKRTNSDIRGLLQIAVDRDEIPREQLGGVVEACDGNFQYTQLLLAAIRSNLVSLSDASLPLPAGLGGLYAQDFGRIFDQRQRDSKYCWLAWVRALMECLMASQPVSRDSLFGYTRLTEGLLRPQFDEIISLLSSYLKTQGVAEDATLSLSHASVATWLTESSPEGAPEGAPENMKCDVLRGHTRVLGALCLSLTKAPNVIAAVNALFAYLSVPALYLAVAPSVCVVPEERKQMLGSFAQYVKRVAATPMAATPLQACVKALFEALPSTDLLELLLQANVQDVPLVVAALLEVCKVKPLVVTETDFRPSLMVDFMAIEPCRRWSLTWPDKVVGPSGGLAEWKNPCSLERPCIWCDTVHALLQMGAFAANIDGEYYAWHWSDWCDAPDDELQVSWMSPLCMAAMCGHAPACYKLIDAGASVNGSLEIGSLTPLDAACSSSLDVIVKLLLKRGADPSPASCVRGGAAGSVLSLFPEWLTPLRIAAASRYTTALELLIAAGADVSKADYITEKTTLHVAGALGIPEAAVLLVRNGADVDAKDQIGRTPLHAACTTGRVDTVKKLLELGADIQATDEEGRSALHHAALHGRADIAQVLIDAGADLHVQDALRHTPLQCLDTCEDDLLPARPVECVRVLAAAGADVSVGASLHLAVRNGDLKLCRLLLKRGALVKAKTRHGETALHAACHYGDEAVVRELLLSGASVHATSNVGFTPLHTAVSFGQLSCVTLLLDASASLSARTTAGQTPLHLASRQDHEPVALQLLSAGADANVADNEGQTPLWQSVVRNHLGLVKLLLKGGAAVDLTPADGRTPLHIACRKGHVQIAQELLSFGADLGAEDKDGRTPVFVAVQYGQLAVVRLLCREAEKSGCVSRILESPANGGATPLWFACAYGHCTVAEELLAHGAKIDAVLSPYRWTVLHGSAKFGRTDCINLLLSHGADFTAKRVLGQTPVYDACRYGQRRALEILFAAGAQLVYPLDDRVTLLMIACAAGHEHLIEYCLSRPGASINSVDSRGWSAIVYAACWARKAAVEELLRRGADGHHLKLAWREVELSEDGKSVVRFGSDPPCSIRHPSDSSAVRCTRQSDEDQKTEIEQQLVHCEVCYPGILHVACCLACASHCHADHSDALHPLPFAIKYVCECGAPLPD